MTKPTDEKQDAFELVQHLTEVDPQQLAAFKRTMTEEVIPEIVKVVEKRRLKAAESRQWQLKC